MTTIGQAVSWHARASLAGLLAMFVAAVWADPARALGLDEAKAAASDVWIEARLTTTYALNENLGPFDVDVAVNDGEVVLSGTVESEVHRELAAEIARGTEGVGRVVNRLEVTPAKYGESESELKRFVDDAEISAKIRSRVVWSKHMSLLDVDVTTRDNVVTLTGRVSSEAERDLLGRIAANTEGVRSVNNELAVADKETLAAKAKRETVQAVDAAGKAVSDGWISAKVAASLALDTQVDATDIAVETSDGVVALSGTVGSSAEAETAIDIAASIKGVKRVDASLEVRE